MEFIAFRKADLNITAIHNDTLQASFQLIDDSDEPVNLSNYTFSKCQLKENELSNSVLTLFSTGTTSNVDLSQLELGIITLNHPLLNIPAGIYQYDIELRDASTIETIAGGLFIILSDITN